MTTIVRRTATLSDILILTKLFYRSGAAVNSLGVIQRHALLFFAQSEAILAVLRGIEMEVVSVENEGDIRGGFLIGRNGTVFRASLPRDDRSDAIFLKMAKAFKAKKGTREYHFYTASDRIIEFASTVGFSAQGSDRYVCSIGKGPLLFSYIRRSPRSRPRNTCFRLIRMEIRI